jgi:ABC-type nitrate/sulfonate/bicarbonate transport system ATPase subunit
MIGEAPQSSVQGEVAATEAPGLDPGTRTRMHALIRPLWRERGMTILMVTHDLKEAFALGARLIVLDTKTGRAQQAQNT